MRISAADAHLKLLDRAVSGARCLTGEVFECGTAHHRSVAILCLLYKIRCNQVHPHDGALPWPCVPVRVTRGTLVAHRYTYAPPRCSTAVLTFPSECSSWTILLTPYSMMWDWRISRALPMFFYWSKLLYLYYWLLIFFIFYHLCL